jgi:hypothetical protein
MEGGNYADDPSCFLFPQTLFSFCELFAGHVQVIIAVAEFDEQLGQRNQVFNLETQRAFPPTAHLLKFRALVLGHANVELERFFRHALRLPDKTLGLMAKRDLQRDTMLYKTIPTGFLSVDRNATVY